MKLAAGIKQQNGTYRFEVAAPGLSCVVIASKISDDNKVANGPDWNLYHAGERCGALWVTTPKNGGANYLEGNLESPMFPVGKIRVAVFYAKDEKRKGELDMVWSPPKGNYEAAGSASGDGHRTAGSSTPAPAPAGGDEDDDIPF